MNRKGALFCFIFVRNKLKREKKILAFRTVQYSWNDDIVFNSVQIETKKDRPGTNKQTTLKTQAYQYEHIRLLLQ